MTGVIGKTVLWLKLVREKVFIHFMNVKHFPPPAFAISMTIRHDEYIIQYVFMIGCVVWYGYGCHKEC